MNWLTGVRSSGVADGDDNSVVNLIPEPKSKSQIFIGHNCSFETHKMFSGFRSRCAIPFLWRKSSADAISLTIWAASCSEKHTCSWIRVSNGPPLICGGRRRALRASSMWVRWVFRTVQRDRWTGGSLFNCDAEKSSRAPGVDERTNEEKREEEKNREAEVPVVRKTFAGCLTEA